MTVAPEPVIAPAVRGRRRVRLSRRWEHALIVLGICLPVPLLAATGLSIPLPATVERLAAALVPWADTEILDESETVAASGAIVYAPGENGADAAPPLSAAANPRPESVPDAPSRENGDGGRGDPAANDNGGGNGSSGGSGGSTSTTPTGGTDPTDPTDPTSPVQDSLDQVGEATQPVVDQVEGTVTDVVGQTEDTVDGVVDGLGK